jgi:hypothetical protein
MLVGVGKFLMASTYLSVGLIPSMVILNPANSTVSSANSNFSGENTIPFWLQWDRIAQILKNACSILSDHCMISSTIFSESFITGFPGQVSRIASVCFV